LSVINTDGPGSDVIFGQLMEIARSSALEEMASGVAHELNQPLGAIATFSQAGERMLDRPAPMIRQALDVFRQINQTALSAGEGIQRIRRLFERGSPVRTLCRLPDVIAQLRPALEALALRAGGTPWDRPRPGIEPCDHRIARRYPQF
jgi:C4-dicarboxylate-specific signal transduction histidine kinase